jgi:ribosomal protein S18 acetylase RimI-like enzyme
MSTADHVEPTTARGPVFRGVVVRPVRADDAELLRTVRLAALADTPSAFGSTYESEVAQPASFWTDRIAGSLGATDRITVFAEFENTTDSSTRAVVGLCGGWLSPADGDAPRIAEIVSMWVAPIARGHGVADALLDAVNAWADARGADEIELWVTRGNTPAIRRYERAGFRETGDHQPLPSDPCREELRMRLHR